MNRFLVLGKCPSLSCQATCISLNVEYIIFLCLVVKLLSFRKFRPKQLIGHVNWVSASLNILALYSLQLGFSLQVCSYDLAIQNISDDLFLQDMGIGHICEGLAEQQNGGLQTLVLWNTQLTSHGVGYLANALVSWLRFQVPVTHISGFCVLLFG